MNVVASMSIGIDCSFTVRLFDFSLLADDDRHCVFELSLAYGVILASGFKAILNLHVQRLCEKVDVVDPMCSRLFTNY